MPTDAGDVAGIAGSTFSGAAAGSAILPGVGTVIGGGIGFVTGLFSNSAENKAEKLQAMQIAREKRAAGIMGEAREIQKVLDAYEADRARKQYASQAVLAGEAVTAAAVTANLKGSSVAALAQSTIMQQTASNLQHSLYTEEVGKRITEKQQAATDASLGIISEEEKKAVEIRLDSVRTQEEANLTSTGLTKIEPVDLRDEGFF